MYSIKGAAEQVGISATTLRAWERRYGIVEPDRTEGGYRIYSAADVHALGLMARLVRQGRPPSLAATEAKRQLRDSANDQFVTHNAQLATNHELIDAVITAAQGVDGPALATSLDAILGLGSFESVVDTNLMPALTALGDAWATGRVSVAGEHLSAHAVMRRLAATYDAAGSAAAGPRVLIGLPPGGQHELGLFAFATAARRLGLNTEYLGANLPVDDWSAAIRSADVAAAVLAISTTTDVAPARRVLRVARSRAPHLLLAVGGAQQHAAPAHVLRLGHCIGDAARELAQQLTGRRSPPPDSQRP